ncbi:MAG: PAS domain S-box protein [Alphaproteobacteria bacterium]|nr:PAS domain S-box protein [Alphaproteobacteria bacterium]
MTQNIITNEQQIPESQTRPDEAARVAIAEDGRIVYANPSFCALSHLDPKNLPDTDARSIISFSNPAKNFDDTPAGLQKVQINGHAEKLDFHFDWLTGPDQKRYLIGARTKEKKPSKKELEAFEAVILQTLKNNDNRAGAGGIFEAADMTQFMAMSSDIMFVIDTAGQIQRANSSFKSNFGSVQNFADLFEETPDHTDFDAQIIDKDGRERWFEWRFQKKDNLTYCTGHDVTAIKAQEKALERREKQLREAESVGSMGHWYWKIGQEALEWSPQIYGMFGLKEGEDAPTLLGMNDMVHREDIGRVNQVFQRAIIEEKDYDMEFRVIQPSGDTRFIRCEGRCAKDDEGEVIALFGIMQDMTERVLYERRLRDALASAESAYAAKTQFLANMSHELRTPLNAIIGFSEMIQRQLLGPIGTEKYLEYISGIRESGEHLLDLISDILDMSKIEAGKYELDLETVNVKKCIDMAVHMMEGRAMESGIKISAADVKNKKLKIVADRRAFMQIMLNLLSNAVKFSKEDSQVRVEAHEREDYLAIKVIDEGIGIPAHKLSSITRPFEQVSSSYAREHEGSGLGLAITKELAEMHGGALRIESTMGEGTTVTVRLPYDAFKATQST